MITLIGDLRHSIELHNDVGNLPITKFNLACTFGYPHGNMKATGSVTGSGSVEC